MDKDEARALIREEIALAMKTLHEAAGWTEADEDALIAVRRTVESFEHIYPRTCEAADAERMTAAENPFEDSAPGSDDTTEALRMIRDGLADSGAHPDHIARLDRLIKRRQNDPVACDHYYPWISEGVADTHCERCGTARPF